MILSKLRNDRNYPKKNKIKTLNNYKGYEECEYEYKECDDRYKEFVPLKFYNFLNFSKNYFHLKIQ